MSRRGISDQDTLFRIAPHQYIHVLDQNTNVTRVELGPKTFIRQDHEQVVFGPSRMVTVAPRFYCVVENPVLRDKDGKPVSNEKTGEIKLRHGDEEVRLCEGVFTEPFPLYPGEVLKGAPARLTVVMPNTAFRLRAVRDFMDGDIKRSAGEEWIFQGPGTYIPRTEVEVAATEKAVVIQRNQALKLSAIKNCKDSNGVDRVVGEEWLIKEAGSYQPQAYEKVEGIVNAKVLTDKTAYVVRALRNFNDALFDTERKTGEEWLITLKDVDAFIPSVNERVLRTVPVTTLNSREYCILLDPAEPDENGKMRNKLGKKKLIRGETSFFLQPGESMQGNKVYPVYVLEEEDGLLLRAEEAFQDGDIKRNPGDRWMVSGPAEYVPRIEVEVVEARKAVPLDRNEGIYVRNIQSGEVRLVHGKSYMLNEKEEPWEKIVPADVEELLDPGYAQDRFLRLGDAKKMREQQKAIKLAGRGGSAAAIKSQLSEHRSARDKTKAIAFRVPHNAAVQIYDYKEKHARVVFGPDLVMLGPDEQFTKLSLSGDKPKRPNVIKSLCLLLGPDFCTDIIIIETSDHARLQLQLSYNWRFEVDPQNPGDDAEKLFAVPDFIGDACKAIASRIRGAVAQVGFEEFHKNSARLIRASVFGLDERGKVRNEFRFPENKLLITSIDIQSVEPVDPRTREALQKSVQLAIEITTSSQEQSARQRAEALEQNAKGELERQQLEDEAKAEEGRKRLLQLKAESAAVSSTGTAKAEAAGRAEAERIRAEAAVSQARLNRDAEKITMDLQFEEQQRARDAELAYLEKKNQLEIERLQKMAAIEVGKFESLIKAIKPETIVAIARAGPEMQAKLLSGLGLQSTLITDGKSPINLFSTANGLVGAGAGVPSPAPNGSDAGF